ncbi:indolepyruvate ferredoxin oxidoreductase family protein [Henriciella aquimarina]|uniref:indolepyruvate ferredoxin oxidoreductase family protein n=1 Tax=Henriciella aquimarina TaxID=545261 RepID=UPI001301F303|nr:indolepyruvate ferredoxin oxidoreductase family protein [Henriciella aquimarina]
MSDYSVSLNDRYEKRDGEILISGVQALVRLMLLQAERDKKAGLNTGGFASGYQGSPLGTLDMTFAKAAKLVDEAGIVVKPAVNEELAATAVAGSQQIAQSPGAKVDGVFSLWYGKGPGLDRASDAVRHGNMQGTSQYGGVVLAVGDDHIAKSSSIVCDSDDVVAGLQVPLFYPADAEEIVTFGLHAFAASRLSGAWTALKIITDVADSTRAVAANELDGKFVVPEVEVPDIGLHNRWPETPLDQERRLQEYKLPAVMEYVRANDLDRIVSKPNNAKIGLVAAGKSWLDLKASLDLLGLSEDKLEALGIALYKPAMIWPLEPERLKTFAEGLETIIVVEEKGPFIEDQIRSVLYGGASPRVCGKTDGSGKPLLPKIGELAPERIAAEIGPLLHKLTGAEELAEGTKFAANAIASQTEFSVAPVIRKPFFCSGCPHNRSTVLPEGSRALSGIGCHGLAAYNRPGHSSFSQMGGEGVHWMGLSPFTEEKHIFANVGDGTYFHSGLLAVRQAVAANLNITYKLLYNDAVAMTGGQSVGGGILTVNHLVDQLRGEGVNKIVISTDDLDRYPSNDPVRGKVDRVEHRDDLEGLQRELRDETGVSVIIYEQTCATEKRRMRKRGKIPMPTQRVFINELVCEGCGDCSAKSNCLSVEPVKTEFGTKRRINQSSCNMDYSCLNGFCPSFVTVEGGKPRKSAGAAIDTTVTFPTVDVPEAMKQHQRLLVAGIGGTGVVTVGALLSMAGHMEGLKVATLDQVGMAQKGGAVTSHIHLAREEISAVRVPSKSADLIIACDEVVGNSRDVIAAIEPGHTSVVANSDVAVTGDFTQDATAVPDNSLLTRRLRRRAGEDHFLIHPFTRISERLLGDAVGANLMMLGAAYQKGWVSFDEEALESAIRLNGVGVDMNLAALQWGRMLVVDPDKVYKAAELNDPPPETLDDMLERRVEFLTGYQNAEYAERYRATIEKVRAAEAGVSSGDAFATAAARSLFKLMSYKDEYEVARLFTDGYFEQELSKQFEGDVKLSFHMAPPILAGRDKVTGEPRKRRFGPWMMRALRVLARMRGLRGTKFDPFGYLQERKTERALIGEYTALLDRLIAGLTAENVDKAAEIAALAMKIRGYGHIKDASIETYRETLEGQLAELESPPSESLPAPEAADAH